MVISDLYAAGCSSGMRLSEFPAWPTTAEAHARIEQAIAYLPLVRNTSGWWMVRMILADLYGWTEPITAGNWRRLDALLRERADDRPGDLLRDTAEPAGDAASHRMNGSPAEPCQNTTACPDAGGAYNCRHVNAPEDICAASRHA